MERLFKGEAYRTYRLRYTNKFIFSPSIYTGKNYLRRLTGKILTKYKNIIMQIYYALYDPATPKDGTYWTWFADILQKETLHSFYNDIAVKHLSPEPNKLESSDIWGGLVRYRNWTVLYRYFNGGYDHKGRPGRYVILTAWIQTNETEKIDLAPIFDNNTLKEIAENSTKLPVPEISHLLENWTGEEKTLNLQLPEKESIISCKNINEASITFANIPLSRDAWLKITKQGITITIGTKPGPTNEEILQQQINTLEQQCNKLSAENINLQNTLKKLQDELQNKETEITQLKEKHNLKKRFPNIWKIFTKNLQTNHKSQTPPDNTSDNIAENPK
ncbi:MAG: hypothetical protein LBH59_07830 [Planctomycetaceae bacterium]|nr:hypothetical protein [Planctomycetaceae bacterium]